MTNGQIAAFVAALVLLATILVVGFAPTSDDPPTLGPYPTGSGDDVVVTP